MNNDNHLDTSDEGYYQQAIEELEDEQFSEALWSKALAKSAFNKDEARGQYVELRVQQMKQDALDTVDAVIAEEELREAIKHQEKSMKELEDQKNEFLIQSVMGTPAVMGQILLLSAAIGYFQESWWYFFGSMLGLIILFVIPGVKKITAVGIAVAFGYVGYTIGTDFWGETGGYWTAGIVSLMSLIASFELFKAHDDVTQVVSQLQKETKETKDLVSAYKDSD